MQYDSMISTITYCEPHYTKYLMKGLPIYGIIDLWLKWSHKKTMVQHKQLLLTRISEFYRTILSPPPKKSTCQTSCDENASCQFFTLEASESGGLVCVLLAECSQFKYSSAKNEVSGRPTSSCGAPACYAEESRCSGVYLTTVEAESAEDCHERCRDMERKDAEDCDDEGGGLRSAAPCGAFTFDEESLLCTLSVSCDLQGGSCDSCVSGHVVCPVGGV